MPTKPAFLTALAALSLLSLGLRPAGTATAQTPPPASAFEFKSLDARQALREIFKSAGVSYTIDEKTQGTVVVSLKSVSFVDSLTNILRQIDATYRIEGGVYQILPQGWDAPQTAALPEEPPVTAVDGASVFVFRSGILYKVDKESMKVVGQVAVGPRRIRITY